MATDKRQQSKKLWEKLLGLTQSFEQALDESDLRLKVLELVPVVRAQRTLGKSLFWESDVPSARARILLYLRKYPEELIHGDELAVIAGIPNYARRIRELRKEYGWPILSGKTMKAMLADDETIDWGIEASRLKTNSYYLSEDRQDKEAAYRWKLANDIRKIKGSMKTRMLEYLRENVGCPVTGEELAYVAKENTWARRSRELRTQDGWPVVTRNTGRPELPVGIYILEEDRQAAPHDRDIDDKVRVEVLGRDSFACRQCHWQNKDVNPADPRKMLELHHIEHHVDGGTNNPGNLITLCNVHHKEVHRGTLTKDEVTALLP